MWQSLWPGCYLPLVWRQVDVNPLPFRVHVEIDKRKLVPVESVVHLQFRIQMKMIEWAKNDLIYSFGYPSWIARSVVEVIELPVRCPPPLTMPGTANPALKPTNLAHLDIELF